MRFSGIAFAIAVLASVASLGCGGSGSPVEPPVRFAIISIETTEILSSPPVYAHDAQVTVNPLSGEVFCCWSHKAGDAPEVFWRHGMPGAFSSEEVLSLVDGVRSWNPVLCAGPDGRVHFAYMDRRITKEVYAKTWSGGEWGPEELLTKHDGWTSWDPELAVYPDGRPVVCWFDHRFDVRHEIMLRVGDGLGNWGPDVRLTNDRYWQCFPDIDIDGSGMLHLSYVDNREMVWAGFPDDEVEYKNKEIFYRTWDGSALGPEVRLSSTPLSSDRSRIAVDGLGRAHVIWLDESLEGYYRLYYSWIEKDQPSESFVVSRAGRRADLSAIACLGERVFVACVEYSDPESPSTGESSLYIREMLSTGETGEPLAIATGGTNLHARLAADPSREMLWVIWMEYIGDDETLMTGESRIRLAGLGVRE